MAHENETTIGLGKTDGFRYIGIRPPLLQRELAQLEEASLINQGQVTKITETVPCTLIQFGENDFQGQDSDVAVTEKAHRIAPILERLMGKVNIEPKIVWMLGAQSSPFNPNTDRNS